MLIAVAVMVLVVVVAGCGGGKKKSAAPPAATSGSTTTGSTTTVEHGFASTKNCQELMALGAKLSQAMQSSSGGSSSIDDEANAFKALASAAPEEIRGDFETFTAAFVAYATVLKKMNFKPGQTPSAAQVAAMASAAKAFSAPKLLAAEQHLSAWSQKNCGVKTTTG
jgi:hypothetical protein